MSRCPPSKSFSSFADNDDDDSTVDSSTSSTPSEPQKQASFNTKRRNRLTAISAKYDLDGDGELDEAEQAMRDRDVLNRGFLNNEEIYDIVQRQLKAKKKAGYMQKLIGGLICFVVLLALSNLGTSMAAAFLAKDLKAESEETSTPVIRIAETGEIAAAQTTKDQYTAEEMTDEQLSERRRLVLREMEEDPHSHQHRRNLGKKSGGGNDNCNKMGWECGITHDTTLIPEERFAKMENQCKQQKTVHLEKKWGSNSKNECVCSIGTSVIVKEKDSRSGGGKKGKDKGGGKKGSNNKKGKDREVIIEREDGRTLHADCVDGMCHCGGRLLLGELGDHCNIKADECDTGLVCERDNSSSKNNKKVRGNNSNSASSSNSKYGTCQYPTIASEVVVRNGNGSGDRGDYCNVDERNACSENYWCAPAAVTTVVQQSRRADASGFGGVGFGVGSQGQQGENTGQRPTSGVGTCQLTVGYGQSCWADAHCGPGNFCEAVGNDYNAGYIGVCTSRRTPPNSGRSGWYKSYKVDVNGLCVNDGNAESHDEIYSSARQCCEQTLWWVNNCY